MSATAQGHVSLIQTISPRTYTAGWPGSWLCAKNVAGGREL